ncbi:lysine--tRNA ligase [Candidatus Micrarchaeota archaeon]|nr:lysine--tRNA ligase [Candidatus Micrarchaeota archaeon]
MHQHWAEQLADRVIKEKTKPYLVSAGMTTSGPAHFGTICEFLFPFTIKIMLEKKGEEADFILFADILDAFDNVPIPMEKFRKDLTPHLGKPLVFVPDPTGQSKSFGDYFLDEVKNLIKIFGVKVKVISAVEVYKEGRADNYAKLYFENEEEAKKIIEETSGREIPSDWSPIMPICEECGKIATTRVTRHDSENYEYACDKDVKYTKGCGFKGKNKLTDHKYKITWRLHWPMWMDSYGTSIEGAGVDHHTKGSSWDTLLEVFKRIYKKEAPIGYRYGFILMEGKKYSKSKGLGLGISELVKFVPVEVIKYTLIKPDLEENIDINPTPQNMLRLIEDFEGAAKLTGNVDEMDRATRKRALAFRLSVDKMHWNSSFLDILLYYQIYGDWTEVAKMLGDNDGVNYLKPFIQEWIGKEFIPEEYRFKYQPAKVTDEKLRGFVEHLNEKMDALAIHNSVFEFAKTNGIEPKTMFGEVYKILIGKERGPRIGKLIYALGVKRIKEDLLK